MSPRFQTWSQCGTASTTAFSASRLAWISERTRTRIESRKEGNDFPTEVYNGCARTGSLGINLRQASYLPISIIGAALEAYCSCCANALEPLNKQATANRGASSNW